MKEILLDEFEEYRSIQHDIDRIRRIEDSIKVKPTEKDMKETIRLLKDFGIKMKIENIPDFCNVAALHRWRVAIINSRI